MVGTDAKPQMTYGATSIVVPTPSGPVTMPTGLPVVAFSANESLRATSRSAMAP